MSEQSSADRAVIHILRRVQTDASFAWHLMGTESLRLCFEAYAALKGESVDAVRERIESNAATLRDTPEIVLLRKRVEELEGEIRELKPEDDEDAVFEDGFPSMDFDLRENLEELCLAVECGHSRLLTVENLRDVLGGMPAGKLF